MMDFNNLLEHVSVMHSDMLVPQRKDQKGWGQPTGEIKRDFEIQEVVGWHLMEAM